MNEKERKYWRKSFTLPPEMIKRLERAAARRVQLGLGDGNCSGVVRLAI